MILRIVFTNVTSWQACAPLIHITNHSNQLSLGFSSDPKWLKGPPKEGRPTMHYTAPHRRQHRPNLTVPKNDRSILCGEEVDGWGKGGEGRRPEDKGCIDWGRVWRFRRFMTRTMTRTTTVGSEAWPTRPSGDPMHDLCALEWYVTDFGIAKEIKLKGSPFWDD